MRSDLDQVVHDAVMQVAFQTGIVLVRDSLDDDTRLVEDLNFDSLHRVTLVMELENRLQIVVEDDDGEEVRTLRDLVELCRSLLNGRHAPSP
ncbi:TPA: hypothetical protein DDZ10_00650 [Candidatus Uhrbacteria bacterium]|nr:MAG: hypothetical protein A3D69_03985 [Candidatus Uhrbacteria bacterium RIFCSPHIGHO2_02_FULL_54_11]HBL39168.1 hypothetical protein [Candidatus Uhrbacteria bacterium]